MTEQGKDRGNGRSTAKDATGPALIDPRLARAIGHPLRVAIMVELAKAPMSPNEFSEMKRIGISDTSYHFRQLHRNDCIEIADEQQVRGAVEHFYRLTKRALINEEEFTRYRELPAPVRGGFNGSILSTFIEQYETALAADTMDSRENRHVTWQTLKLDEEGFNAVMDRLMEVYEFVGAEQLAAERRMKESGEEPSFTTLGMFGFESPAPKRGHQLE